jgi:hypothetical protein
VLGVTGGSVSTFNPYSYVRGNTVNLADPSGRIAPLLGLVAGAFLGGVVNDMTFGGGQRTADLINSIQNRCISGILNNAWVLTQPGLEALAKMGIGAIEGPATAVTGFADLAGFLMGRDDWSSAAVHRAIASTIGLGDAYDQSQFDASYQAGKTVGSAVILAYGIASLAKGIGAFLDELDDLARNFGTAMSGFGGGGGGVGVASRSATAAAVAGRSGGVNPWAITGGVGSGANLLARANDPNGDLHHIATDKNRVSGNRWTTRFEELFNNADLSISTEDANIVRIYNHRGPHSDAYHSIVYQRLSASVEPFAPHTPEYTQALINGLDSIRTELLTPGSALRNMVTR